MTENGERGPTGQEGFNPREKSWSPGLLEKLTSGETLTPQEIKWRTWQLLEGTIDRKDDWTARVYREKVSSRLGELNENVNEQISSYLEIKKKPPHSSEFVDQFRKSAEEGAAVLKLFVDFGNYYEKTSSKGDALANVAFSSEILELHPVDVLQKVFSLEGFKNGENQPSLGEQVDKIVLGYAYLAVNADERRHEERDWMEASEGFKRLFPGDTVEERIKKGRDWVRKIKLGILPHVDQKYTGLKDKHLEDLTPEEQLLLDKPSVVVNRFAVSLSPSHTQLIEESLKNMAGQNQGDIISETQARIAEKLARRIFRYFGLASYYGGQLDTKIEGGTTKTEASTQGAPWADGFIDVLSTKESVLESLDKGDFVGPNTFTRQVPDKLYTNFFRLQAIKSEADLDDPREKRSLWELIWKKGLPMKDLPWNRTGDYPLRAYWMRYVSFYMEDTGILPAFKGSGWIDKPDMAMSVNFLNGVHKAIRVTVGEQTVVNGDYEKWFNDPTRKAAVEKLTKEKYEKQVRRDAKENGESISDEEARRRAENLAAGQVLKESIGMVKTKWKETIINSIKSWHGPKTPHFSKALEEAVKNSGFLK